jgi:hypothetical protein
MAVALKFVPCRESRPAERARRCVRARKSAAALQCCCGGRELVPTVTGGAKQWLHASRWTCVERMVIV